MCLSIVYVVRLGGVLLNCDVCFLHVFVNSEYDTLGRCIDLCLSIVYMVRLGGVLNCDVCLLHVFVNSTCGTLGKCIGAINNG